MGSNLLNSQNCQLFEKWTQGEINNCVSCPDGSIRHQNFHITEQSCERKDWHHFDISLQTSYNCRYLSYYGVATVQCEPLSWICITCPVSTWLKDFHFHSQETTPGNNFLLRSFRMFVWAKNMTLLLSETEEVFGSTAGLTSQNSYP